MKLISVAEVVWLALAWAIVVAAAVVIGQRHDFVSYALFFGGAAWAACWHQHDVAAKARKEAEKQ